MLSMFKDKDDAGNAAHWSMTRVVAFLAALTINYALITMSRKDHVHDIAWPFCVMYVVTLLAVPLQMMFKFLQVWFTSAPGKLLLKSVLDKVGVHGISLNAPSMPSTTTEMKVTTGDADK